MRYAIIVLLLVGSAYGRTVDWDAAQLDLGGQFLNSPQVRLMIDNSAEIEKMTSVRWTVEIHSGNLGGVGVITPGSEKDIWGGLLPNEVYSPEGDIKYHIGVVMYTATSDIEYGTSVQCEYMPDHPDYSPFDPAWSADEKPPYMTEEEWLVFRMESWDGLFNMWIEHDIVPAGVELDYAMEFRSADIGGTIELFSTAVGEVTSDQGSWSLTDTDPTPQTVPEPGALALLVAGAAVRLFRRK